MSEARREALTRALELSRQVLAAAEQADSAALGRLDAERLRLLKSARTERGPLSATDHRMLVEVAELNDRALGAMEHHRRIKERAIDLAAVGRRAVAAYAVNGRRP